MAEDGICGARAPAIVVRDGRARLLGTRYDVADVIAALARGERLPGLTDEQLRLAEAHYEREAALRAATHAAAASTTDDASRIASSTSARSTGAQE